MGLQSAPCSSRVGCHLLQGMLHLVEMTPPVATCGSVGTHRGLVLHQGLLGTILNGGWESVNNITVLIYVHVIQSWPMHSYHQDWGREGHSRTGNLLFDIWSREIYTFLKNVHRRTLHTIEPQLLTKTSWSLPQLEAHPAFLQVEVGAAQQGQLLPSKSTPFITNVCISKVTNKEWTGVKTS